MDDFTLEVCADSVESVLAAERGGATRIELCGNIVIGGTTPSLSLYHEIRKHTDIRMHALIRPRFGDFCYSAYEFEIMRDEVKRFRECGIDGVVIGILTPDGRLDLDRIRILIEDAKGISVTLHRAFDMCRDPYEALEEAVSLGIDSILTSGQKNICTDGVMLLKDLQMQAKGRIRILAGAGVDAEAIKVIRHRTGITDYHMTGKAVLNSPMLYRKADVNMGLPSLGEYEIIRTDEVRVRAAREVLETPICSENRCPTPLTSDSPAL